MMKRFVDYVEWKRTQHVSRTDYAETMQGRTMQPRVNFFFCRSKQFETSHLFEICVGDSGG